MRTLVREASELVVRLQPSERDALLLENELIRTLRPIYNVDGAYSFLYPAIGTAVRDGDSLLCFTTHVGSYPNLGLRWHGAFRSRPRTRGAFDALVALLGRVGHREPRSRLRELPRIRGSQIVALRRVESLMPGVERLLAGESSQVLQELAAVLLEKPDARHDAEQVGEHLRQVESFFQRDARRLRDALRAAGRRPGFVAQEERDALFIAHDNSPGDLRL